MTTDEKKKKKKEDGDTLDFKDLIEFECAENIDDSDSEFKLEKKKK